VHDVGVLIMSTYQCEESVAFLEVHSVEAGSYGRTSRKRFTGRPSLILAEKLFRVYIKPKDDFYIGRNEGSWYAFRTSTGLFGAC